MAAHPLPSLLPAQVNSKMRNMAAKSNKIYNFELWGSKVILFLDSEAARAAFTKGAAKIQKALTLVYTL